MLFNTIAEFDRPAAFDNRPGWTKRVAGYARHCGRNRIPFADVEEAIDGHEGRWPAEARPGTIRASLTLEAACEGAYRLGQIDSARRAVAEFCALSGRASRSPIVLFEIIAQATRAPDGDWSTFIEPADLVEIARPHVDFEADYGFGGQLAERQALTDAKDALNAWHRPITIDEGSEPGSGNDAPGMTEAPPTNAELDEFVRRLGTSDDPSAAEACQALRRIRLGLKSSTASNCQPVDLWQRYEAPELPAGLLPPVIEEFARSHADIMGADPAGLAMAALVTCAAAVTDRIEVQVKQHDSTWRESARLWVGLVGMPSTKKSPLISAAMAPLLKLDQALAERNATAMQAFLALPKVDQAKRARPKQPQYVVEDATIESLQEVLKDTPRGLIAKHPELSGWFGSMDKYNPGKGAAADRAFWLKAYDGGSYNLNRVARGAAIIPNLSINLLGGIQPEPLRKAVGDSVDDGLIQRLIPVILKPARVGKDSPTGSVVADYRALVERLARLEAHANGNLGRPAPLTLSEEARAVRVRLELEHVELVGALEDASPKLAAHFGKHDGLFARLCLIWHCIENVDRFSGAREISGDTAERVAAFMKDFLRPSAIAFYSGMLGLSAGHEEVMALAAHIVSANLSEVTARDVQRSTRKLKAFTALEACRLCEKLEAFGWLEPTDSRAKSNSPRWKVVPAVHTLFEDRGRAESERRAVARAALKEALNP